MRRDSTNTTYCKVCLLPHDEEIHAATLSIREWHRWEVVKNFEGVEEDVTAEELVECRVA